MAQVSKKTRPKRAAPARKAPAAVQGTLLDRMMGAMWAAIAAGDPLRAEIEVATCMAVPRVGQMDPEQVEDFSARILVNDAIERWGAEGTALLRLLMALGSSRVRRAAGAALEEMTRVGIYPPDWVNQVGKAVPGQAMRRYDVFGDDEAVAVTFRYGEVEHGIVVQVDLTGVGVATLGAVSSDPVRLMEAMSREDDPFDRTEPIGLAEARRRLEGPLARCDEEPTSEALSVQTLACLPIARARMRRLPADAPDVPKVTTADRAAVVEEFMSSPLAADAVAADSESTRFWAEVFTDYNRRTAGAPPAQLGPRRLARILLRHVPVAVVLSAAQRGHLEPAVTAWVRWAAESRGLDEAATARLTEALAEALAGFDETYDNPGTAAGRAGLASLDARIEESSAPRLVFRHPAVLLI
jgi:hypothetical protein